MAKAKTDEYAGTLLTDLRRAERGTSGQADRDLVERVIRFLDRRLTDAAKAGCHHCDDVGEPGAPCWWCGLKRRGRRGR